MGDTGEVAKAASPIIENLAKLTGPMCEEMGLYFGDKVRAFRQKNITSVIEGAVKTLEASSKPLSPVPPRLLIPIFEAASVEDNPALQDMWSGLLASASGQADDLSPSYVETLKALTPAEARALKVLYDHSEKAGSDMFSSPEEVIELIVLGASLSPAQEIAPTLIANALERVGLLTRQYTIKNTTTIERLKESSLRRPAGTIMSIEEAVTRLYEDRLNTKGLLPELAYTLAFTAYGIQFMRACQGPQKSDSVGD